MGTGGTAPPPPGSTPPPQGGASRPTWNTGKGFFVSGSKIYDANGVEFRMREIGAFRFLQRAAHVVQLVCGFLERAAQSVQRLTRFGLG